MGHNQYRGRIVPNEQIDKLNERSIHAEMNAVNKLKHHSSCRKKTNAKKIDLLVIKTGKTG